MHPPYRAITTPALPIFTDNFTTSDYNVFVIKNHSSAISLLLGLVIGTSALIFMIILPLWLCIKNAEQRAEQQEIELEDVPQNDNPILLDAEVAVIGVGEV
ncbi:hypothetical protein [Candidatus Tisiphia endosymbiont of Nemotelus uliginosus]|uniref:hypothetical protein n=1 Tax=Candidatus Tisiphia endosymbiont of Nemotelus uliginosus TaxID=3077926 RepID=UPI0035C93238